MRKTFTLLLFIFSSYCHADKCKTGEILIASCNFSEDISQEAVFCEKGKTSTRYFFRRNGVIEFEVKFNSKHKLKRWIDLGTYTTYIGFNRDSYSYILGIPEEKPGVVAFFDVNKNGKNIKSRQCLSNSFGAKNTKNTSIEDVSDATQRDNKFRLP